VSSLSVLWQDATFRAAIGRLIELSEPELSELDRLTQDDLVLPADVKSNFQIDPSELEFAFLALRTMYEIARDEAGSPRSLLDELVGLAHRGSDSASVAISQKLEAKRPIIEELIRIRPAHERLAKRRSAQTDALPSLDRTKLTVDLRLVDMGEDGRRLVPVVLARLFFDETLNGNPTVTFQLTDESLKQLEQELRAVRATLTEVATEFGNRLL